MAPFRGGGGKILRNRLRHLCFSMTVKFTKEIPKKFTVINMDTGQSKVRPIFVLKLKRIFFFMSLFILVALNE